MTELSFEIFFLQSQELMVIAGIDGYFKRVNPAFCRALGFTEAEVLAQPYFSQLHPEDVGPTGDELHKLESGIDTLHFENRFHRKDGGWCRVAWTCPGVKKGDTLLYGVGHEIAEGKPKQ